MFKPVNKKLQKVIMIIITGFFILSNFYSIFLYAPEKAQATAVVETILPPVFGIVEGKKEAQSTLDKVLDELKAIFFKNILGTLFNMIAKETAVWIASGAKGGGPSWMQDPDSYFDNFLDNAMGEMIFQLINKMTGLNVCTMDPKLAISLALSIPMFPEEDYDYDVECTFEELQDHWEEIGERGLDDFLSVEIGIGLGGTFDESTTQVETYLENETMLRTWNYRLDKHMTGNCEETGLGGSSLFCDVSMIHNNLIVLSNNLNIEIENLREDILNMKNAAGTEAEVALSTGQTLKIISGNIDQIREAWIGKLQPGIDNINEIVTLYGECTNKSGIELIENPGQCATVMQQLGIRPLSRDDYTPVEGESRKDRLAKEGILREFESAIKQKAARVIQLANSIKAGYDSLKTKIDQTLVPDYFEGGLPYTFEAAKDFFKPQASYVNSFETMVGAMMDEGFETWVNKALQKTIEGPFESITNRVSGIVETPAELLKARAIEDLTPNDSAKQYTKSIAADALGVFLSTLWNEYMRQLLENLGGEGTLASKVKLEQVADNTEGVAPITPFDVFNPYEEEPFTPEGARSYVEKLGEQFQVKFSFRDINLLADFQLNISGEVNPNIYNNVIDPNFALAINDKLTIGEALEQGRLIANHTFSWGEDIVAGTYNLSNLKKLRKARVIPLGLELASQLVRDCNYRATLDEVNNNNGSPGADGVPDYADFSDLTLADAYGYDNPAELLKTQRLKNCLFRPLTESSDVDEVKRFNQIKLNEVATANLGDVVSGYSVIGDGTCGDFDDAESPFCNLVNPNWVLKIPITKCSSLVDAEPYGEILMTNQTGQRYSRCTDFSSCIVEDKQGGCVNEEYGFCVREENTWQFGANSCPSQYNSCRTYTVNTADGVETISYLKNTLSGNDVCGPDNAGCFWYSTDQSSAGLWDSDQRIYLNRYVQNCVSKNKGCNEFYLYRSSNTNVVADSGFEDTLENYFPVNWDLRIKKEVADKAACDNENGSYYQICTDYRYEDLPDFSEIEKRDMCLANGGQWVGSCTDGLSLSEAQCDLTGNTWEYDCLGAVKAVVTVDDETDCITYGQLVGYCLFDVLEYNLCANAQYTEEIPCLQNAGEWVEECDIGGQIDYQWQEDTLCNLAEGTWLSYCQDAKIYDSDEASCEALSGIWRGYGPFSDYASVVKDGLHVRDGLSKLKINISTLYEDEELQLRYVSKFDEAGKMLAKPGDIYTASSYVKTNEYLVNPVTFSLIGGINDISSRQINLADEYYYQASSTIVTGLGGSEELSMQLNLPGGECEASDRGSDRGVLIETCVIGGVRNNTISESDCPIANGQWQRLCLRDNGDIYVYLDAVRMSLNSLEEIRNNDFVATYSEYNLNNEYFYKKPPAELDCRGYVPGDPSPILGYYTSDSCNANDGFWDQPTPTQSAIFDSERLEGVCYMYPPDNPLCTEYMKICAADEVGCQIYTPQNGDPAIPGVISTTDLCPAECVGYDTYKQQSVIYEPNPDPLYHYFIPETAINCNASEVGCSEFTNLGRKLGVGEAAASQAGLEQIEYYTYLRQCISPGEGLPEKTYFTWQGSSSGPPQLVKYVFEEDELTGAPKMIDNTGDCRVTLGENNFNCIKLYDSIGNIFYRDIRKTVVVSADCVTFRKTESTQENCDNTNGNWQTVTASCLYDGVPSESIPCGALADGCRAFVGNQGNNVYVSMFDTFEDSASLDWYTGTIGFDTGNLQVVGESVVVGGHSLRVSGQTAIHKFTEIQGGNLYTLSFWAKAESSGDKIRIAFDTARADDDNTTLEEFASLSKCSDVAYPDKTSCVTSGNTWLDNASVVQLTTDWQNYTLGPVYISWQDVSNNSLIFDDLNSNIYLDNITLKVIKDNVYVIKDSWTTPDSCDINFFGGYEQGAMLGCQAYNDMLGQTHYFKSFTNLCRESVVGCQLLIDTSNSLNANEQTFNADNSSDLDDYTVLSDKLMTAVLNEEKSCLEDDKGCQKLGKPIFEGQDIVSFSEVYLKNDPDKYINVPQAIMCNEDALGCQELANQSGGLEYYKIEPTKLCYYSQGIVNGQSVEGWFKNGSVDAGCGSLPYKNCDEVLCDDLDLEDCSMNGGFWSEKYEQCTIIWNDIFAEDICSLKGGEWILAVDSNYDLNGDGNDDPICLADPFTIYKTDEANKYQGYVGECSTQYHGCTELIDVNPNFISNGSFEFYDQAGRPIYWAIKNATSGSYAIESDDVRVGDKSIKLLKRTDQDCPSTALYPNTGCVLDNDTENLIPTYALSQTVPEVQRGKSYKMSFYYKVPEDAKGRGTNCYLPEAHFALVLKDTDIDRVHDAKEFELTAETDWKKVDVLYTIPSVKDAGVCKDLPGLDGNEDGCIDSGNIWLPYEVFNLELYLSAPQNINKEATRIEGDFVGNCLDSYIMYDLVEVKDNTEDSYYVLDTSNSLDRSSCVAVDWDGGCVQFINTVEDVSEIMKVKRDRKCGEWAVCSSHCSDTVSPTESECINVNEEWFEEICTATELCIEEEGGICTKVAPKNDNVRYNVDGEPIIVKRITDLLKKQGYIYRFGAGEKTRLAEWRAGDYSGYTMVDRMPLEVEITDSQFEFFSHINNLGEFKDHRYTQPICKILPAEDAPLPYELSQYSNYKNLFNLYSQSENLESIGNGCFYEKATALGATTYFSRDSVGQVKNITKLCTSPEEVKGKVCISEEVCVTSIGGSPGTCAEIENVKVFTGFEGMCLEYDTTNPLYEDLYKDYVAAEYFYQPYACLTYYPYNIDICPIHTTESGCILNPQCRYSPSQSQCCRQAKYDVATGICL